MMSVLPTLLQPPPTAEELALKEQVTQVLTSQGVLAKLKAELRAAVFEVMHEREGFATTNDPTAPKLSDFPLETRTTAMALIIECLQFFHWEHALRVLLAETNAEDERHDSAQLAKKLGLGSTNSSAMPTLFQLVESRVLSNHQSDLLARPVTTIKRDQFDDGEDSEEEGTVHEGDVAPKARPWERDEDTHSLPAKEPEPVQTQRKEEGTDEGKEEEAESSAEIEESMAEEVPSGSELEESNFTNYEDEGSQDYRAQAGKQPTDLYSPHQQEKFQGTNDQEEESHDKETHESNDEDAVQLAAPPPAPAKLPSLPPLVNGTKAGDTEEDFDAEEEAERLKKLDAALQAMEAEDDTGTLQQLKKSLQMELQEQDSLVSSGGLGKAEEDSDDDGHEPQANKSKDGDEEDDDGYGSSDFEEEEEIASEISEEMESMPELSDKEDESEDGAATSAAEVEPPSTLRNDTRVDSEDALNSYDYIEDVEKGGW